MEPRLLALEGPEYDREVLDQVVAHIQTGGLVAMPTETVYGFGCLSEPLPVGRLQKLKGRGENKPFLLLISGASSVPDLRWSPQARELASVFWPGALTLILSDPGACYPPGIRSEEGGVAVRVSPHPLVKTLLGSLGCPLVSTSANDSGSLPAQRAEDALQMAIRLGADEGMWVLDGGFLEASEPSTIVDCTGPDPLLVRSGAIPFNRLKCVLPEINENT